MILARLEDVDKECGDFGSQSITFWRRIKGILDKKYHLPDFLKNGDTPPLELTPILYLTGELTGKKILELGCGCINCYDDPSFLKYVRLFEPWLARTLHELGAEVSGVDKGDLSGEKFRCFQQDLSSTDSLSQFQEDYFDLVVANFLFHAPSNKERGRLFFSTLPKLKRVTRKGGGYIFSNLLALLFIRQIRIIVIS